MNKGFKLFALTVAAVLLALSLCSCEALNDARESRGLYNDDRTEITYKGAVYRLLDLGDSVLIDDSVMLGDTTLRTAITVTEKDVPILVAEQYGETLYCNEDETVITNYASYSNTMSQYLEESDFDIKNDFASNIDYEKILSDAESHMLRFVREDKYEAAKAFIETDEADHFFISYDATDYDSIDYDSMDEDYFDSSDSDTSYYDWFEYKTVPVPQELAAACHASEKAPASDKISYKSFGESVDSITLHPCDSGMLLTKGYTVDYFSSAVLLKDKDQYYFWDGKSQDEKCIYPLKDEAATQAKQLFNKYPLAVEYFYPEWMFENSSINVEEAEDGVMEA